MTEPRTGTTANILAGFASFLCAGLGQLLQARPGPAVLHFIFAVLLWLIWLGWVVHFYSAYDAATWEPHAPAKPAPRATPGRRETPVIQGADRVVVLTMLFGALAVLGYLVLTGAFEP